MGGSADAAGKVAGGITGVVVVVRYCAVVFSKTPGSTSGGDTTTTGAEAERAARNVDAVGKEALAIASADAPARVGADMGADQGDGPRAAARRRGHRGVQPGAQGPGGVG